MDRRKFITSGIMGASMLSMFPSFALTNDSAITLSNLGAGFEKLGNTVRHTTISNLSNSFINTHKKLIDFLNDSGYIYNTEEVVKLNKNSCIIPLLKKSFLSFERKEIALIVENKKESQFYILNEKISNEFNLLIDGYKKGIEMNNLNLDVSEFVFPVEIVKFSNGKATEITYKNSLNNTISLKNKGKKSKTIIC